MRCLMIAVMLFVSLNFASAALAAQMHDGTPIAADMPMAGFLGYEVSEDVSLHPEYQPLGVTQDLSWDALTGEPLPIGLGTPGDSGSLFHSGGSLGYRVVDDSDEDPLAAIDAEEGIWEILSSELEPSKLTSLALQLLIGFIAAGCTGAACKGVRG